MAGEILTGGLTNQSISSTKNIDGLANSSISVVIGKPEFTAVLAPYGRTGTVARVRILKKLLGANAWTTFVDEEVGLTGIGPSITKTYNGSTYTDMRTAGVFILLVSEKSAYVSNLICTLTAKSNFIGYSAVDKNKLLRICNNPMAIADKYRTPKESSDVSIVTEMITTSVGIPMQNGQCIFGQN